MNPEPGAVWLERVTQTYPHAVWLNPEQRKYWNYTESNAMIRKLFANRMFPLTLEGLDAAMRELTR
jgi:uncharacterized protein with von Willebrand factor type A (vWA) domain